MIGRQQIPAGLLVPLGVVFFVALATACGEPVDRPAGEESAVEKTAGDATVGVEIRELDLPAARGSFAPRLVAGDEELLMTWWEPVVAVDDSGGHRLRFARYSGAWSAPRTVVEGTGFFANWADFPNVIREPSGDLLVHWLAKTGEETYAYSIFLARSSDDGLTWEPLGKLNDDDTDTEHGFVSFVPEGDAVRAYWLDGRLMAEGGPMTVRTALVGETIGPSELIDDRVCECCPTTAVETASGPMVAYRDRSEEEVREIALVRRAGAGWGSPEIVTSDGWQIPGCPVNGPTLARRDGRTAMAWFTGADDRPRVSLRFLEEPVEEVFDVDVADPLGRVDVVLLPDGDAVVSWLGLEGEQAELRLRRVSATKGGGEPVAIARISGSRSSGIPQLELVGNSLFLAWVEVGEDGPERIQLREVPAALLPPA